MTNYVIMTTISKCIIDSCIVLSAITVFYNCNVILHQTTAPSVLENIKSLLKFYFMIDVELNSTV